MTPASWLEVWTQRRARIGILAIAFVAISAAHVALGVATHGEHVAHVFLELGFLLSTVAGAVWFGVRGGTLAGAGAAVFLGAHAMWSWRGQPMENANQLAMMFVYVVVGTVAGALVDAEVRERRRRLDQERIATREKIVEALGALQSALGYRHEETRDHGDRVADLAVRLGRMLGLDSARLEQLRLAALVHDLGKIGVPDDVLLKPDELTPAERRHVQQHPAVAANILKHLHGAEGVAEIVLAHHERLDGSGYPLGLRSDALSAEARILAVADVYTALAEPRPYKAALSPATVLGVMAPLAGTTLDADAVEALRQLAGEERLPRAASSDRHCGASVAVWDVQPNGP